MRKSLFMAAAVALLAASTAQAGPTAGTLALGTSKVSETPLGIRYWASEQVGIDFEVGFWILDVPSGSGLESMELHLCFGLPINVWECSDVWLHFKPAILVDLTSYEDATSGGTTVSVDSTTDFAIGGFLEMEFWALECLSFSVWHGIAVQINDGGAGGSTTDFHARGTSLGNAGFHLYF